MKQKNIADIYKLTPIQQGILYHSVYAPESGMYFEQFGWTLNQELIVPMFARAWQYIVDQHPILRTAFFWKDLDEPLQVVQRQAELPFIELDWSERSLAEQDAELERYLQRDRAAGFDLTEAPLIRVTLIRGGPEIFHLVCSYHHLLLDGWSVPLVLQDVFGAYAAFCQEQAPRLNRRRPYRDYLAWLHKQDLGAAEGYWRQQMQGFTTATPLPVEHGLARPTTGDDYGAHQILILPEQTEALQTLARQERVTLNTLVQGAWALLLQRYSGESDLVFGATVSSRPADLAGSQTMLGCFINTLPMRVQMPPDQTLRDWLHRLQQQQGELQQYAYSPLVEVLRWSDVPYGQPLFESIVVFENYPTEAIDQSAELRIFQKTNYPLTLVVVPRRSLTLRITYDNTLFTPATIERLLEQLKLVLENLATHLNRRVGEIDLLGEAERQRLLVDWNATAAPYDQDACLHTLIERQVARTPDAVAVVFEAGTRERVQLSYAALNVRANQLAHYLRSLGVGPETRVAICMKRSAELLVGLLAILKAGGAYVPLDPAYPATRLQFMLGDCAPTVLLSESRVAAQLPGTDAPVVLLDRLGATLAAQPTINPDTAIAPEQTAYLIYTSGSTGQPKGVMVPHGPVVNFLSAMQQQIGCGSEDALLATTSISFDISVLELFWPLTQGAKVVILAEHTASGMPAQAEQARSDRAIDFSLFYFASDDSGANGDKYRLLIEGAKFADQHGFTAVWTPERHFHAFGGLYPNPAITSAALATITQNVQLRAGSVVMPLHDPIRVAEEWSVVDNISQGRVGIAFASGWHANDFVFFPERYAQRKQATADGLAAVQKLWRGETLTVESGTGTPIDVTIFPKPVQSELPVWITAAGNPETFIEAGRTGANVLTHLLGQSLEDVAEKVRLYRAARAESGLDPESGKVTLMLHTFIGEDRDAVRELVREPFTNYLRSSVGLIANLAKSANIAGDIHSLSQADMDALLALAFDRYFETSALFGTVETCAEMIERLRTIGVDEIGCLVDFGVAAEQALAALHRLNTLRELTSQPAATMSASLPAQAQRHHATLLQGTPSLAKLLLMEPDTLPALRSLRALLLGGEALPTALAQQLLPILSGRLINMYGPTETTIWSATHPVTEASAHTVPIGKPIANTEIYILDARLQPTPIGVPGELYIGGVGVTRGYFQQPELTAERYRPDPFGPRPGGRIYKTGDLARYRVDGTIEFLGRVDFQVKLRGFRIELGEIEAVLSQHPAIREAVVVARQDTADTRLVAYVVEEPRTENQEPEAEHRTQNTEQGNGFVPSPVAMEAEARRHSGKGNAQRAGGEGLNFIELRNVIKERLPEYMVPAAFVTLDALPLTPNGKVDRKALPAPDAGLMAIEPAARLPRTPTEEVVAALWARVLGVQTVGVHDNFFMLGGHSLLATQILSRVRETFQVELALSTLFTTPTVAGMAEHVERAQHMASGLQAPPIEHVARDRPLPLSFAQQRLWFLQQVEPESATYNNATAVRLTGALDRAALLESLTTIVERHEILRTTFPLLDGRPVQQIMPHLPLDLPLLDLSSLPADEQQAELLRLGTREAQRPFDLVNGPLIRALIFKHSEHEHTLLVTMHHIVSDGWSLGVLIREMAVLYTSLSRGQSQLHPEGTRRALPELPIQYADYATWQRNWLQGEVLEGQQAYWKQQLSGHIPALNLPTDHPRPATRTYRGAKQRLHFPRPLLDQLNQLSRSAGTTLFMTLLSGLNALLSRYSGQTDLVVGSPIANRHHGQVEELIGCFVNTLVLRADLRGNPTVTELLTRTREVALGAYAHQDLPFEQVVEIAEYEADLSRHPLFQVFFILQNTPMPAVSLGDLMLTTVDITTETAKFDLAFELIETEIGLIGSVEYNTDLFEASTIARMIGHFQTLLTAIVANPEQRLSDLVVLGETERQQLLVDWNATTAGYPQNVALHTLIEQQAARTPEATALVFEGQPLTYVELNARANQLAHYLRTLGVRVETRVAVCMERSLELVIALVGVLKAGGAYVPIDPSYPTARIEFMLADAAAPVLLTQQHLLSDLPPHSARVLRLDADWSQIAQQPSSNPALLSDATNLAYVIYTSGSTGQPKGAMNTHQAIVNRLLWMQDAFQLNASDRVLQKTPFSFDVSVWEFFWPLLTGATLVVAKPGGHQDSAYLVDLIAREQITTLHFVPSMLQVFLEEPQLDRCQSLRRVICSGEALPLALQERFFSRLSAELHNLYGPTEAAVDVSWWPCQPNAGLHTVPIGRPIANTRLYVLDQRLNPVPIGVPGELHIGGIQLARGYLNRPELTAERFIPDPFSHPEGTRPNARLYRTGDLARFLPDGAIEFGGRLDFQVKVRGFRIELGEIETALGQHPQIREVVVVARQDVTPASGHPETRLVAYFVPQGEGLTVGELRRFLEPKLPEYMIPSAFVTLDTLPLSPNGKVDRRALPSPDSSRPELDATYVAPETAIETRLAEIWKQVLGVEQVGIHDNFFELGGDSILSFQIITRANEAGLHLTPGQIFQHRTIAALARVVDTSAVIQAEQGVITGTAPLTPIQQWFFAQQFAEPHHWNQAVLLDLRRPLDPALLEQTAQHLVSHHDALRLRFTQEVDGWQQHHADTGPWPLCSVIDLTQLPAYEQLAALAEHATAIQGSLDLAHGPLLRIAYMRLGAPHTDRLLVVIHHLVVDGVSWRILLEDLHTVYGQLSQAQQVMLPAKTTAFRQWAEQLAAHARTSEMEAEHSYWHSLPWSEIHQLPVDSDAAIEDNLEAGVVISSIALSADETRALLQDVPQAYQTQINDVLLTALAEAFAEWTGQRTLLVDMEGHGREDLFANVDLSRTVGWFTALYPVLLDVRSVHGPGATLKAVKEQLRQIPRHGLGYGLLRYLDPARGDQLAALPQSSILFNYLGQLDQVLPAGAVFTLARGSSGLVHSPHNRRTHLLEINGYIVDGNLRLDWAYNPRFHAPATIERLAQASVDALQTIIAHCTTADVHGFTPSDFPLVKLEQHQLDAIGAAAALEDLYPLSSVQHGMLFHTLSAPESGVYHQQMMCIIEGELDVSAFERAWQHVVDRHPALRTSIAWSNLPESIQIVNRHVDLQLAYHDWRTWSAAEQAVQLQTLLEADREQGFDLTNAPLLRLALLHLDDSTYRFVWSYHHIILDGWSMPVVFRQVLTAYHALVTSQAVQIEAGRPYHDYIAWLGQQDLQAAERFWKETLSGFSAPTPLAIDRAVGGGDASAGKTYAEQILTLSEATTSAIQRLARQHHLTINTIIQGVWALLLSRYSGEHDIVFGAATSGRPPELLGSETMVGLFINTLPVRVQLPSDATLIPWLQQLQQQQAEMRLYEYTPLAQIQSWSSVPRGQTLFESILVFENYPIDALTQNQGAAIRIREPHAVEQTNYPLTVIALHEPVLQFTLSYDTGRFAAEAIARLQGHLQTLLEAAIAAPDRCLSTIPLLSDAERRQLLVEWNATDVAYQLDTCLHTAIEAQVARSPEAIAVIFEAGTHERVSLTYAELNVRANQLAHALRAHQIGPETRVAVCMERSLDLVVSLLAVLKAGGTYVPIDPSYPSERVHFMLDDSQPMVLLTQQALVDSLPPHMAQLICVDSAWPQIAEYPQADLPPVVTSENAAYMIYTSGSTGQPKGAINTHAAIVNRLLWMQDAYGLNATDRVLQKTPFSFDVSVWEFFWPLRTGATLVVAKPGGHQDPSYLAQVIAEQGITTLHFVPSMLQIFLAERELDRCQSLRRVVCSGEALPATLRDRFFERLPHAELHNLYGPTEAAVDVSYWPCNRQRERSLIPIGYPIANTRLYVLDAQLNPVPIGVAGELHIGGVQVGRGYLNRPALTAEKFIPDPFSQTRGARLYKTGDLTRYLPDGSIEYLGRLDFQVKVRGNRIELGEIEHALRQHPDIHDAAVVVRQETQEARLVAYIVPRDAAPTTTALRSFLQATLPEYMVPAIFMTLDALPLSPNGKLNRNALPLPDLARPTLDEAFVAPRTRDEQTLAAIWREVLGMQQIGIHDNFFALGGDSILSIRVLSQAQEHGLNLSLQQLFQYPTIAALAQAIEGGVAPTAATAQIAPFSMITPADRRKLPPDVEDAYPLAVLQTGMFFHSAYSPESAVYHNVTSTHVQARLDIPIFEAALQQLAARHPVLRTSFDLSSFSEPLQMVHGAVTIPLEVEDISHLSPPEQEQFITEWVEREKQHKFDWTIAPLLRFHVHLRSADAVQLSWTEHHAIVDGWSVASMITDLFQLYFSLRGEAAEPVAPPPQSQFKSFVALERQALQAEEHRRFWDQLMSDSTATVVPRQSRAKAETTSRSILVHNVPLARGMLERVSQTARMTNVPIKSVLLAAHLRVMSVVSGQTDVLTGLVANGRSEEADGDRTLGLFLNSLPLRMDLRGGTWLDLMQATFNAEREMLPHRWYPMSEVQRSLGGMPLFETLFTFVNFHVYDQLRQVGGLEFLSEQTYIETNYDFAVYFNLTFGTEIGLHIDYNPAEFSAEQVATIGQYYARALEAITHDPYARYESTVLLSEEEQQRLLVDWKSPAALHAQTCMHQLVAAQAQRTPDATAVVAGTQRLAYAELDRRANQLAWRLQALGVGPEIPVGICLHRSQDLVVGLLGILKAGAAYLPLDPNYPLDRIRFMLTDAQAPVVITQQSLRSRLPESDSIVIELDHDWSAIEQELPTPPSSRVHPDNLAYVIYTSGSTGRPKGVAITHRNAVAMIEWAVEAFTPEQLAGVLASTSICFDLSVYELFVPLSSGGSVILAENALQLPLLPAAGDVTLINTVPSAIAELLRLGRLPEGVRTVNLAGEPLKQQLVEQIYGQETVEYVYNLYGPSEDTTYSTGGLMRADTPPTIGRPLVNTQVYLLDAQMELVPIGTPGELYISGAGITRGYLNRPGLTAERYVPDPFSTTPGTRMYKTGDVARYLPDGNIEFLGRVDHQVKVRGFRIELGEIEAALVRHPAVRDAVVIDRDAADGDKRLVAYLVQDASYQGCSDDGAWNEWQTERVSTWQTIFDEMYHDVEPDQPATFNLSGWISSYTGQPMPAAEMQEWVDHTVERIAHLNPQRVLEIGCGTGLLLFRIAPHCEAYWATDFSQTALDQIADEPHMVTLPQVKLLCRSAEDFSDLPAGTFDTVIINSVIQYFPSVEYLVQVLEGATRMLAPGGRIFIGDVRSLPLLETFQASVQFHQSSLATPRSRLRQRVHRQTMQEEELVVDPALFTALKQQLPQIAHIEIQLKRGQYHNELTRFRYDVTLHVDAKVQPIADLPWHDWQQAQLTIDDLRRLLKDQPPALGLMQVPNARVTQELAILDLLKQDEGAETIGAMRNTLQQSADPGVDPEQLWALGAELSYDVAIQWSASAPDCFDAVFVRRVAKTNGTLVVPQFRSTNARLKPLADYATVPLRGRFARRLEPQLRRYLEAEVPAYMIPSNFVLLEALPLTPNGKLNRRALPDPDGARPDLEVAYVAPETELEQMIAAIWKDVLHVERIGIHDNFFDMGGHSLLMAQAHGKLRQVLTQDVSMLDLFKYPTISALVQYLSSSRPAQPVRQTSQERVSERRQAAQRQQDLRRKHRTKPRNGD